MLAVEASMRNTHYGRWHLMGDHALFNPVTSLPPQRGQAFWSAANKLARQETTATAQAQYWSRVMHWLAVDQSWSMVRYRADSGAADGSADTHSDLLALRIRSGPQPPERVLWFGSYRSVTSQRMIADDAFAARLREIAEGDSASPLIEMPQSELSHIPGGRHEHVPEQSPSIGATQLSPEHWIISIDSPASGVLCIKQFQDGNWRAELSHFTPELDNAVDSGTRPALTHAAAEPVSVYRCDYLFSAVMIPEGTTQIVLRYQPRWLAGSLAAAAAAWLVAAAMLLRGRRDARQE
jgi:hypothetical protein